MIKLLVVDDHPIVIAGLKQVFSITLDITVVDEAYNGQQLFDKVNKSDFDIILLDISFPGESGIELLKRLKIEKPDLPVIMLSTHPEEEYAVRALRAGASGYVTKTTPPKVLIEAIRKVSTGRKYISPSLAENLASYVGTDMQKAFHENLSDREFQVMRMLVSGKKVKEIADALFISDKTVGTYKTRIMEKLHLKNDVQLAIYAIRNKLIE